MVADAPKVDVIFGHFSMIAIDLPPTENRAVFMSFSIHPPSKQAE
jgi:hypothetical protein